MAEKHTAWQSSITQVADGTVRLRGYDVTELMQHSDFCEVIFLLHQARLPSEAEKYVFKALLIASADHGPQSPSVAAARMVASGNRASFEAAVAAGVLAVGDAHGGAGQACMQMIARGLASMRSESLSLELAAEQLVTRYLEEGQRISGIGHRWHGRDPRAERILSLAEEGGIASQGVRFLQAVEQAAQRIKPLPINVDGAMAAVLLDMNFQPVMAKALFIVGRVAGISAHVQEELSREKAMRFKEDVHYDGPAPRSLREKEQE